MYSLDIVFHINQRKITYDNFFNMKGLEVT